MQLTFQGCAGPGAATQAEAVLRAVALQNFAGNELRLRSKAPALRSGCTTSRASAEELRERFAGCLPNTEHQRSEAAVHTELLGAPCNRGAVQRCTPGEAAPWAAPPLPRMLHRLSTPPRCLLCIHTSHKGQIVDES